MTPKEKAQDIVDSMMKTKDPDHSLCICYDIAKRCALIAVDEIISLVGRYSNYWQEVRNEIENL